MPNPIADPFVESSTPTPPATWSSIEGDAGRRGHRDWINRRGQEERLQLRDHRRAAPRRSRPCTARTACAIVFLRGRGGKFSAGADLDWMREAADLTEDDNREDAMAMARMLKQLYDLRPLTVALVEGGAFGGGAGLVAACDMAIAVKDAKFAFSEVKLGLIAGDHQPLCGRAPSGRAARAACSPPGELFDAAYAEKIGLVDEVVADAAALEAAQAASVGRDHGLRARRGGRSPSGWSTTSSIAPHRPSRHGRDRAPHRPRAGRRRGPRGHRAPSWTSASRLGQTAGRDRQSS